MADFEVHGEASLGPDHLIEDVTAIIDKLDELAAKIDELDAKIDELSHKDISIAVVIDGIDKLDELRLWLDELDHTDYTVKLKIDIQDKDRLDALYLDLLELELTDHNVDVKVKVDGAAESAAKIEALTTAEKKLDDQQKKTKDSTDKFKFSLWSLAPLAIPASAAILSLVGAAGGLVAAFGAMAVPALAFGFAAKSTYTNITTLVTGLNANTTAALANADSYSKIYSILNKNSSAFGSMTSAMQTATVGYVLMKNALSSFQNAVQLPVTMGLYEAFNLISQILGYLAPAVYAFGMAFDTVLRSLSTRLKDPTFQKFFSDATKSIGTLVTDWGGAVINIIEGITAILDAFLPLGVKMSGGFLKMTQDFDKWAQHLAQSEGFKRFVHTVETDGPLLLNILGQVIGIVVKLVGALGESKGNAGFLRFLDNLLKTLNGFLGTHEGLTQVAADLGLIGVAAVKLGPALGPLMSFVASPIGIAVVAVLALGAAFYYAYTHSKQFHDWVVQNISPIWDSFVKNMSGFVKQMKDLWPTILQIWHRYLPQITILVTTSFQSILGIISGVLQIILGVVQLFAGILSGKWGLALKGLENIATGFANIITSAFIGFFGLVESLFEAFGKMVWGLIGKYVTQWIADFVTFIAQAISNFITFGNNLFTQITSALARVGVAVTNGLVGVLNWFVRLPGNILNALGNLGNLLWNAGVNLIQGFINGIENMFGSVQSTLSSLTSFLTSWKGPPSKDKTLLYSSGQMIIDGFVNGLESRYSKVSSSLGGLTKTVGSQFGSQFTTDISAKLNASLNSKIGSTSIGQGGNMAGGTSVNYGGVTINNPTPETASQTLTKMLQSTAAFGIVQAPMGANFPGG